MRPPDRSTVLAVVRIAALTVAVTAALAVLRVPSPALFGGLVAGMTHALTSRHHLEVPTPVFRVGQALVGAVIGTQISVEALREMAASAGPIGLATLGTVVISVLGGLLLARRRDVSAVTGVCAMIAGGASGVVATARDLGADDRVVTVVQYLRVAVVLMTLPVVTALVFHPPTGRGSLEGASTSLSASAAYVVITVAVGLVVARVVPVTTMSLLGPLAVGAVLAASGWLGDVAVPVPVEWLAFLLIGVQVGLRFTRESLASIVRMLPAVVAIIVGLIVLCGVMGALLARFTSADGLTAYLATTPGGLFAVVATAADSGSDVTYVMAVQLFRLVVILAFVPLLARWLRPST